MSLAHSPFGYPNRIEQLSNGRARLCYFKRFILTTMGPTVKIKSSNHLNHPGLLGLYKLEPQKILMG